MQLLLRKVRGHEGKKKRKQKTELVSATVVSVLKMLRWSSSKESICNNLALQSLPYHLFIVQAGIVTTLNLFSYILFKADSHSSDSVELPSELANNVLITTCAEIT